jgi:hypothetical protein
MSRNSNWTPALDPSPVIPSDLSFGYLSAELKSPVKIPILSNEPLQVVLAGGNSKCLAGNPGNCGERGAVCAPAELTVAVDQGWKFSLHLVLDLAAQASAR